MRRREAREAVRMAVFLNILNRTESSVELGVQNPLRHSLLQLIEQAIS